jgi:DNA-binding NarL/FixJ family response regulator
VVGPADLFERVRGLDLGVPLWRVRDSGTRQLSEHAIVLLDLRGLSGADAVDGLRTSASRSATIAVSHRLGTAAALDYLEAGAFGAIDPATADSTALRRSLLGALRGEPAFTREVLGLWLHRIRHESRSSTWHLTARQREVITLVASGATDREISEALNISLATAQKHVANVLKRLGASNRAAAVNIAFMASLIQRGTPALERRSR